MAPAQPKPSTTRTRRTTPTRTHTQPSPSWHTTQNNDGTPSYHHVRCMACREALKPFHNDIVNPDGSWNTLQADNALMLNLTGAYGELLDTWDGPQQGYLCLNCTQGLVRDNAWFGELLQPALNINVGHTCNGTLTWTPEPHCTTDPDQHGWRPTWVLTTPDGTRARFDTEQDAQHAQAHHGGTLQTSIIAHTRNIPAGHQAQGQHHG